MLPKLVTVGENKRVKYWNAFNAINKIIKKNATTFNGAIFGKYSKLFNDPIIIWQLDLDNISIRGPFNGSATCTPHSYNNPSAFL